MSSFRLFDSHAHVNFVAFEDDWRAVLDDCQRHGVAVTLVGSQLPTSRRAIELAELYPEGVYAAVGLHPVHVADQPQPFRVEDYAAMISASSRVVAIGETGIDHFRLPAGREAQDLERQREVFIAQLRLARDHELALVIHTREHPTKPPAAYAEVLGILRREQAAGLPQGVIHCFLGTVEEAEAFTALGLYVGITGIITFEKRSEQLRRVAAAVPLERLVVETDSPYLAPQSYRGKRNQPQYVAHVVEEIARCKGVSAAVAAEQTSENARRLFGIKN
ncbi:MAG: TatD DNase family protein [Parcubacteria group bacterium Gr01-1014_31]|nr:MAG: TatD DNase family protein [Parcubacteria group bacterium Gr01-1014_31]